MRKSNKHNLTCEPLTPGMDPVGTPGTLHHAAVKLFIALQTHSAEVTWDTQAHNEEFRYILVFQTEQYKNSDYSDLCCEVWYSWGKGPVRNSRAYLRISLASHHSSYTECTACKSTKKKIHRLASNKSSMWCWGMTCYSPTTCSF